MLSLLMCGGKGTRLGRGEKPLFEVCGMKLIDHSLNALKNCKVIAITSPYTPRTESYLRDRGYEFYRARGMGFIEDYRECIASLSLKGPLMIASADIVYLREGIIEEIIEFYRKCGKRALKVVKNGEPVGINVIIADIDGEQDEESYIVEDVININTIEDAKRAESLWTSMKKG
uniref:TIGR00454 family protein n=1 Tax=Archaeoglobus fulgidus TaxID=2234 RepID=A0A7J2TGG7_ARCFL